MITAKLNGGLGNQMFQIAVAYSLALDNGDECAFNMDNYVVHQGNSASTYKGTIFMQVKELSKEWEPKVIIKEEQDNVYQVLPYKDGTMLTGYFQNNRYLNKHREFIINLFSHKPTIDKLKDKYENILDYSVSVHVRRGDYLKIGVNLNIDYYYSALKLIEATNILIFSDDIKWCKYYFPTEANYIEGNMDYEDLYLMSLCNNNITANSSFSWWGAYLNKRPNKIIMPKPFTASHNDDIYFKDVIWN